MSISSKHASSSPMHQSFLTSRGVQAVTATYGVHSTHRMLSTTCLTVVDCSANNRPLYTADFHDKSAPKGTDIVLRRGDASGPVIALSKFKPTVKPAGATGVFWADDRPYTTYVVCNHDGLRYRSYRVGSRTAAGGAGGSSNHSDGGGSTQATATAAVGNDMYWRDTTDYGAATSWIPNSELVDAEGTVLAVMVLLKRALWSRVGTLYVLAPTMESETLDLVVASLMSIRKRVERDAWKVRTYGIGGKSKPSFKGVDAVNGTGAVNESSGEFNDGTIDEAFEAVASQFAYG
jgi:hypothetical protein